jgi:hypothetical protein
VTYSLLVVSSKLPVSLIVPAGCNRIDERTCASQSRQARRRACALSSTASLFPDIANSGEGCQGVARSSYLLPPASYLLPPTSYLLPPASCLLPPTPNPTPTSYFYSYSHFYFYYQYFLPIYFPPLRPALYEHTWYPRPTSITANKCPSPSTQSGIPMSRVIPGRPKPAPTRA